LWKETTRRREKLFPARGRLEDAKKQLESRKVKKILPLHPGRNFEFSRMEFPRNLMRGLTALLRSETKPKRNIRLQKEEELILNSSSDNFVEENLSDPRKVRIIPLENLEETLAESGDKGKERSRQAERHHLLMIKKKKAGGGEGDEWGRSPGKREPA